MSFVITFCIISLVFCFYLGITKGAKSLCNSIARSDGETERWQALKKQVKEFLKKYNGHYKARGLRSPKPYDYRGKLYCEGYDFGITIRADSIDEFLLAIEKTIRAGAWANRVKRLNNLPPAERLEKTSENVILTIFSISLIVFLITLFTTLSLSPEDGEIYTTSLAFLILSLLVTLGTLIVSKVISIKSIQAKNKRTTHIHSTN